MARVVYPKKWLSTNPLKSSAPLGAALAYLGVEGAIPLFHGSQGCTAFAMVAMVRHFKEAVPLQTTAMNEVSTILGGAEHIEEAIENLRKKASPRFIGIASTALTETRGEDVVGELKLMRERRPDLDDTAIVYASTPDFSGGLEDGWARAVEAIVETLVPEVSDPTKRRDVSPRQVNLLAGSHLTVADIEELVRMIEAFGLDPIVLPDLSKSLDGHVSDDWSGASLGGTSLDAIASMSESAFTLAAGESMRPAAQALERKTGAPFRVFQSLTGLKPVDAFVRTLMGLSDNADAPARIKRERSRLVDGSLDAHFHIGGARIAIAADPDLLFGLSTALAGVGGDIVTAVSTTGSSGVLERAPSREVAISDLGEFERRARDAEADILITHAHGRHAAARLGRPLIRAGFPIFDQLGAQDVRRVGYLGTRSLFFEVANAIQAQLHTATPEDFGAARISEEFDHAPDGASPTPTSH